MKPEQKVEIQLWDWLMTKSSFVKEIYFNHKNVLGMPLFQTEGLHKKPDLVISFDSGYGKKYCAIEVKDNSSSKNVLDGQKVNHIYWKNYMTKKTSYLINNKLIEIDYFLIATQDSINGFLFKDENVIDNFKEKEKTSKFIVATKYKIIPRKEGHRTFEFVRTLWNNYKIERNDFDEKCGMGILIANSEDNYTPYMMITNYNGKRWGQRWWKI